ncbi:MAG: carbohydrate porin [Candidatus Omnitrophota bacterium]
MRAIVVCIILMLGYFGRGQADEENVQEKLKQLEARIEALEEKSRWQQECIVEQKQCILGQDKKIAAYESRLAQFDTQLHRQEGVPIQLIEGLEIGVGSTVIVQGIPNVNNATAGVQKKVSRADASYSADITLGKEFREIGGRAFLHLEAGRGAGLEDDLTLYSNVNRDAGDSEDNVQLTEFWYEQLLFADKAALTFGKLDPSAYFDNNEAANDETTQFLGRIFRNSPVIEFPDNAAGIRLAYLPSEWLELGLGVFDGDSDGEKIADSLFNIAQVTFKTGFFELPGNYRFLAWNSNGHHTKWLDSSKEKEAAYGFGLSFDQKFSESVTVFCRYGWENPKVYNLGIMATGDLNFSLEHSWSAGLQLEGHPWGREKDMLAFAVGQVTPSDNYKDEDPARNANPEGHLEVYYRIFVNDHLSISPDFQYVWNPFGKDVTDDTSGIFVGGMRAQVDF